MNHFIIIVDAHFSLSLFRFIFLFISDCSLRSVCWTRSILIFLLCCDCHFDSFQFLSTSMHALLPPDTFTTTTLTQTRSSGQNVFEWNEKRETAWQWMSKREQIIERRRETIVFSMAYDAKWAHTVHSHEYVLWFRTCGNGKNGCRFDRESLTEPWQWQQHRYSSSKSNFNCWLTGSSVCRATLVYTYVLNIESITCAQSITIFSSRRLSIFWLSRLVRQRSI